MGLQLLEREKRVYYSQIEDMNKKIRDAKAAGDEKRVQALQKDAEKLKDFQPDFAGKEYLLQRQLQPVRGSMQRQRANVRNARNPHMQSVSA